MNNYTEKLHKIIIGGLEDLKAEDIVSFDIGEFSSVADKMVIASGTSSRHLNAVINSVDKAAKENDIKALSIEGDPSSGWILIDFGDIVVHVMLPETRAYYELERLWSARPAEQSNQSE